MTGTRLDAMLSATRDRIAGLKPHARELARRAAAAPAPPPFARALRSGDATVGVIAEVKRRSPSTGAIREDLDPVRHALAYQRGGAVAISVLTDAPHFGGSLDDLECVAQAVSVPVLRKDFILDELQLLEARAAGASGVLLIARALPPDRLGALARTARANALGVLVEVHSEPELDQALTVEPTAVGVNSRDLATFAVDLRLTERLLARVPAAVPAIRLCNCAFRVLEVPLPPESGSLTTGRFGPYGGRYVPETLMSALDELARVYDDAKRDPRFWGELDALLTDYVGRPTPVTETPRLGAEVGVGVVVLLKREDLNHTGAHKINNTLGQVLLARRMGKRRIIAETGAGQHGVATATVCARFGLECVVYMGEADMRRQRLNVYRMELMGARVVPVTSGTKTLKDATNEALRDWVTNVTTTHYIIGSVVGPDPFPRIVRDFQSVIGREARAQTLERWGKLPSTVVACVGGGSNAMGIFSAFLDDRTVALVGVEAAGEGLESGRHAASLGRGRPGVFPGSLSYLLH